MTSPFLAEIRIFPFNFPPKGWAFCDGQLLPISQNTALFSLLGTTYGGDGKATFALPNFQGNVPVHAGQGPGLSQYFLGETTGSETVTLLTSEMPAHTHNLVATTDPATTSDPTNAILAEGKWDDGKGNTGQVLSYLGATNTQMNNQALGVAGGSQPHNNLMPYLTLNFCIALQGIFPARG
jgi:microcystin-dependent protein